MAINAIIYKDENGTYCAEVPAFPGCHSCGDTFDEAAQNIREAAALWLETVNEDIKDAPSGVDMIKVAL